MSTWEDMFPDFVKVRWEYAKKNGITRDSMCACGHPLKAHNYSGSVPDPHDVMGYLYECRGDDPIADNGTTTCKCRKFLRAA